MKLPKWVITTLWLIIALVLMVYFPWMVSQIGPRLGWDQEAPVKWNFAGLIAVVVGLFVYVWCFVFEIKNYREAVRTGFIPRLLVTGPYKYSQNPMYVAVLFAWIGWAIFYGSPAVFFGLVFVWAKLNFSAIPRKERHYEEVFGDEYKQYKTSVRRWIGWI